MTVADHVRARRLRRLAVIGGVGVGGTAPIVVQSMTNTDTEDAIATARIKELAMAAAMVGVKYPRSRAAGLHPLDHMGIDVPLIGDFHHNGHRLLTDYPACAEALSMCPHQPRATWGRGTSTTGSSAR